MGIHKRKARKKNIFLTKSEVFSQSFWMLKLINKIMLKGKKSRVEKIILNCFYRFKLSYINVKPYLLIFRYLIRHRPSFDFSRIRKSRIFKKVPIPIMPKKQLTLILTWFVYAIQEIKIIGLQQKLYNELLNLRLGIQKTILTTYKSFQEFYYLLARERVNIRFRWK